MSDEASELDQLGRTTGQGPKTRAREAEFSWSLEPHVCRVCFGRVLSRPTRAGLRVFQCSNCGVESEGQEASAVCCCGMKIRKALRDARSGAQMIDAGIRCRANDAPTPEFPSIFIAAEAGV